MNPVEYPDDYSIQPIEAAGFSEIRNIYADGYDTRWGYQIGIHAVPGGGRLVLMNPSGFPIRAWVYTSYDMARDTMDLHPHPVIDGPHGIVYTPYLDSYCENTYEYERHPTNGWHWRRRDEKEFDR